MSALNFVARSNDYARLFDSLLEVKWDINENLIHLTFQDTNSNFVDLINLTKKKEKISIVLDIFEFGDTTLRYYELELLPVRFIQSEMSVISPLKCRLNAVFKILKSDVNFVEPTDE